MATIILIMNKDFDGYESGKKYSIEISLGRRYIENGIAVPLSVYLDNLAKAEADAKQEVKQAKADAKEAKAEAAEEKKAALVEKKSEDKAEKAILRKAHKREKS